MLTKLKKYKTEITFCIFLFLFPIIVELICALPFGVEGGDLLGYYATTFGLLGSFYIYRQEKRKSQIEHQRELRPCLIVEITEPDKNGVFSLSISNLSHNVLTNFYLYDTFLSSTMKEGKNTYEVTYNKTSEETNKLAPQFNITMDDDIIGTDGYPKYVQILCDDSDGNTWDCWYQKIDDCGKIYYYPQNIYIP